MILSINTCNDKNSIAIFDDKKKIIKMVVWQAYQTQSKDILIKIDKLLKDYHFKLEHLTAIAVFQGPGSFTGLRVGISVANTLGWALNIPVIPVQESGVAMDAIKIAKKAYKISKKRRFRKFVPVEPYYLKNI